MGENFINQVVDKIEGSLNPAYWTYGNKYFTYVKYLIFLSHLHVVEHYT
jgi:hypothetical protein